jgi:hypothetical protein
MWAFFSRRLRTWLFLVVALPLARMLIHRLAVSASRRDPAARSARVLGRADSTVTSVSQRAARKRGH